MNQIPPETIMMPNEAEILDADLLSEFESETVQKAARDLRRSAIVAFMFFPIFGILDYFVYAQFFTAFVTIRIFVMLSCVVMILIMMSGFGKRNPRDLGMAEYLICCLSIVLMVHLTGDPASPYYAGINLVLITFISMLPLDLTRTAIVSSIVYLSYLLPVLILNRISEPAIFLNKISFSSPRLFWFSSVHTAPLK
jgi:hypothetical protein